MIFLAGIMNIKCDLWVAGCRLPTYGGRSRLQVASCKLMDAPQRTCRARRRHGTDCKSAPTGVGNM